MNPSEYSSLTQEDLDDIARIEASRAERDAAYASQYQGTPSIFGSEYSQNLIEYQLELDNILERIEHILNGDNIVFDPAGRKMWVQNKDNNKRLFNEYGTQEILKILSLYLNRNLILSNFSQEIINQRLQQLGHRLTDFITLDYQKMGWDDKEKIKHFEMIVMNILDVVEAAYNRAYNGGERISLHESRFVTQSVNPQGMQPMYPMAPQMPQQNKQKFWNPLSWIRK